MRTPLTNWQTITCNKNYCPWSDILETDDRWCSQSEAFGSLGPPQPGVQIGPSLVADIHYLMERSAECGPPKTGYSGLGCQLRYPSVSAFLCRALRGNPTSLWMECPSLSPLGQSGSWVWKYKFPRTALLQERLSCQGSRRCSRPSTSRC